MTDPGSKMGKFSQSDEGKADFCQKHAFLTSGVWPPCSSFRLPAQRLISGHLSKKSEQSRKNGTVDDADYLTDWRGMRHRPESCHTTAAWPRPCCSCSGNTCNRNLT